MGTIDGCPFCSIVEGQMDAHIVHENDDALAFLDVNPVSKGHTLVIPKQHAEELTDLDRDVAGRVFATARDVAQAAEDGLEPAGINLLQSNGEAAGQEIHHMHIHVIPRYETDGLSFSFDAAELEDEEAHAVLDAVRSELG